MPNLNTGFTAWGATAGWQPYFYNERSLTYTTNATKMRGSHEIRFGFDMVRFQMDQWQPEVSGGPRGSITFSGDATGASGYNSTYLNSYATFLLGLTTNIQKSVQLFQYTNREWQFGWYVRDRWQVTASADDQRRRAVRVLPADFEGRPRHRAVGSGDQPRVYGRRGQQPEKRRHHDQQEAVRPPDRALPTG